MSSRTAVSCFAACTLSLFAAVVPAAADSLIATIASDGTTVMSRPAEKSQVVSTAAAQTIVTIMDREGDWLWILLPPDVNGTRHAGWIRTRDVEGAISDVSAARLESGRPKSVSTRSRQRTDRRLPS